MTFLEALKTGRPMRRKSTLGTPPYLTLGEEASLYGNQLPRWREITTGRTTGLHSFDYTADDWEVMP